MEKNYSEINLENEKKGGLLVPTMIAFFVILIAVFAIALFMRGRNQQSTNSLQNFVTPTASPVVSPTPGIDQEISNVDLGTDAADFNSVQKDINRL